MKRFLAVAILVMISLAGCNQFSSIFNPVIGSWGNTTLGLVTEVLYNADGSVRETVTALGLSVIKKGKWTSNAAVVTRTWADSNSDDRYFKFINDNNHMIVSGARGGPEIIYIRQ